MLELINYLERIDYFVEQYCKTADNKVSSLAPGISRQEVDEIIDQQAEYYLKSNPQCDVASLPLKVSEEIYQLYGWHNGKIEDYPQPDNYPDSYIEYVSFLNEETNISFYNLQSTANVTKNGFEAFLFLDEGGGYIFNAQKQLHKQSNLYDEYGKELGYSLTELMKDFTEALDMTLILLHERGNFNGDKQERLESRDSIINYFLKDPQKNCLLHWLSIWSFLNAALKC